MYAWLNRQNIPFHRMQIPHVLPTTRSKANASAVQLLIYRNEVSPPDWFLLSWMQPQLQDRCYSFLQPFRIYFIAVWIPNLNIYVNINFSVSLQFCFWHIFYFWIASTINLASHSGADSYAVLNPDITGVGSRQVDVCNAYNTIQLGGKTKR